MGFIDTVLEYVIVGILLLGLLVGLGVGLLRGRGGSTKELPKEHRPPERPKGTTDHRSGTIVLDRPKMNALDAEMQRQLVAVADEASKAVVDEIAAVSTGAQDKPLEPVVIESVTISE